MPEPDLGVASVDWEFGQVQPQENRCTARRGAAFGVKGLLI
ncbi:hypothetical protein [Caballeronia sp. SEWSISQ10-4 2]|nr:hypothetical protein [Caballeronia sp. SEWSISQ10-4 2]